MALITCSECNNEVSELAANCPGCGAPVQNLATVKAVNTDVQTIEATSKKLKLHLIYSVLAIIIGMIILIIGSNSEHISMPGFLLTSFGMFWICITKFRIWWHHK